MAVQPPRAARRGSGPRRPVRVLGSRAGGVQVSEIQRSRLLAAAVGALDELGYEGASVARITARARISRRTFYDLFDNREQCTAAVLEGAFEQLSAGIAAANLQGLPWRERVRGGLWVILSFFDREPALARVCVVESQRAGQAVLARRREMLDQLAAVVDEGRSESTRSGSPVALTAQGVVGGVFSILHTHLLDRDRQSPQLRDLLSELMAMIVLPYVGSAAARRERERQVPAPVSVPATGGERFAATPASYDWLAQIPMRLTYRTARVLQDVGQHPSSSNREVAERVGIHDQGQMSKLLARLQRLGLLQNTGEGQSAGAPNAWSLTQRGEEVEHTTRSQSVDVSRKEIQRRERGMS